MNAASFPLSVDFTSDDNSFTDTQDKAGVSVHWALENIYDYYLDIHERDSYDNAGGRIRAYAHFAKSFRNAFWHFELDLLGFGDGAPPFDPFVALNIVGHEFTHGVTQYTADFIYQSESGALDESFCDIFGSAIDYRVNGEFNWIPGSEIGPPVMSMIDPNSLGNPDTYGGINWADPTNITALNDNGGVHINSSIQNYWFYLLVEGGSGINDNSLLYEVEGIGWDDAEQIVYRNLAVYMTLMSDHADARAGAGILL